MSLEEYLKQRYTEATAAAYLREISAYRRAFRWSHKATHAQITAYIGTVRNRYPNVSTLTRIVMSIKAYYAYLCISGRRKDNPARSIRLRDKKSRDIQLQDLFSEEELSELLARKERFPILADRNKILTGFLIYQGLQPRELELIEVGDVNLQEGTLVVRGTPKTNGRTLPLRGAQVMLLHDYIKEARPKLLGDQKSELLFISERHNPMCREDITKHVKRSFKGLYGSRMVNCQTIRQSVITNLLKKGTDLRLVQVFAGHKWASTTERYKQSNIDTLKAAVVKHHPFA